MPGIYRFYRWLWSGLDLLFPPVCGGCDQPGFRWCPDCQRSVVPVPEPICEMCGVPQPGRRICAGCQVDPPAYRELRSWLVFEGPVRAALHRLKYRRNIALGDALAVHLAEYACTLNWPVDLVIPVPLGKRRLQERGYNQVGLLAMPVADLNGWRYLPKALQRVRETASQVGLTRDERRENMREAFRADPGDVIGKVILVMDDVATTGATLTACSAALKDAGATQVFALTLARALPHHGLKDV